MKRSFSAFVLKLVGQMPRFQAGWLSYLQQYREHQLNEHSKLRDELCDQNTPNIEISDLYVAETFFVEDIKILSRKLANIFSDDPYGMRDVTESLAAAEKLHSGSWYVVGTISRKQQFWPGRDAVLKNLPEQVRRIHLEVHRPLASMWIVSFHFELEQSVSAWIPRLFRDPPLAQVSLSSWFPFWKFGWMMASTSAENESRAAARVHFDDLVRTCSGVAGELFPGFFRRTAANFLPSVIHLRVKGAPSGDPFSAERKTAAWLRVLELDGALWKGWRTSNQHILLEREGLGSFLMTYDTAAHEGDPNEARDVDIGKALSVQMTPLAFSEVIDDWVGRRRSGFFQVPRTSKSGKNLLKALDLNREGLGFAFGLRRLSLEWNQSRLHFHYLNFDLDKFKAVSILGTANDGLGSALRDAGVSRLRKSQEYVDLLVKMAEDEISHRNARLMFSLQRRLYWLTLAAVLIACCTFFGTSYLHQLFAYLRHVFSDHIGFVRSAVTLRLESPN